MAGFVSFKQEARLVGYIRFSITKGAFGRMSSHEKGVGPLLTSLSARNILLITKGRDQGLYEVHTDDGIYLCRITDDRQSFLIIGFNQNTLIRQNNALKNGICFRVDRGIIIQIKLTEPYNYFFDIVNGRQLSMNRYENQSVSSSINIVETELALVDTVEDEEEIIDEEYEPVKPLANLLEVAEKYAILSSELEELRAHAADKVSYFTIKPLDYDRIDRVAYEFEVDDIDVNLFKMGTKVDVEDGQGQRHSGEIISLETESDIKSMGILFHDQIDIRDFHEAGWISLSFSSVNKDVQLAAIEKIRSGEAAAKYMDRVLGKGETSGFEDKDLGSVEEALSKQKYPPNESQMKAIKAGINTKDVFLGMRPPGTGKTTVILEWVRYFVKHEKKRVLVSSQNNKAVDNVIARIADEEDIDVIRIGSESKLQAEIIPFMFENKVRSLRKHIVNHTQKNMEEILNIKKPWDDFIQELNPLTGLNVEVEGHRETLNKRLDQDLVPMYLELIDKYKEHHYLVQRSEMLEGKINKGIGKIENYQGTSSMYKKVFGFILKLITSFILNRNMKKLYNLKEREIFIVTSYNEMKFNFNQLYQTIEEVEFDTFFNTKVKRDKVAEEVYTRTPETANKWDLFKVDLELDIFTDNSRLLPTLHFINQESSRAEKLVEAIDSWKSETQSKQNYALNEIVLESVDLVGATCIGINSQKRFADLSYDVTIIDEAGQIQVHNALVPMSVSNKLIMLGDHKQIPPVTDEELISLCEENNVDPELLNKSLFEKMYDDMPESNKLMLDTQYRMPAEIAEIISQWFYGGNYLSADFKKNTKSELPFLSRHPLVVIDTSKEKARFELKSPEGGSSNKLEATAIAELVERITQNPEIDLNQIGIISAYKAQVKLIKDKLMSFLEKDIVNEMVATLDSYQGQERDIIIYSFTKSSKRSPQYKRIGFLNEIRRLNVALSRCKKNLILVGDMDFLSGCQHMDLDDDGEPIYEKSEKQFSDFIKHMMNNVEAGSGDLISYSQFKDKIRERSEA